MANKKGSKERKNQHIVPKCVLQKWKEESKDPKYPHSKLSFFNKSGSVQTINFQHNSKYFAGDYYFEFEKDDPKGIIEKKLSELESDYSDFAQKIINNESSIKREKGTKITGSEKSVVFTFAQIQQYRSNMPSEIKYSERSKQLRKIELTLDAYIKFKKLSISELSQKCERLYKEFQNGYEKFRRNHKKWKSDFSRITNDPFDRLVFYVVCENYVMGLKYFDQSIWPLPILGCFNYDLGFPDIQLSFEFIPITPRTVIALSFINDSNYNLENKERIEKRFCEVFEGERLFPIILEMTAYYFRHSKIPIVVPETWNKNLNIKKYSEKVSKLQQELKIKNRQKESRINKMIAKSFSK